MKLLTFDLDGTLLDTLTDIANSCNYALSQLGFPTHPIPSYKIFVGNGLRTLAERTLPIDALNEENILYVANTFAAHYEQHHLDNTKPYPDIMNTLSELKSRNILLSVASNKYHEAVVNLVKYYFGEHTFDLVLGHREGVLPKPSPQILFDTFENLGVAANDCWYIGDSSVDMETAKAAEVKAIGVSWGFRSREELLSHDADHIITSPLDLFELLDRS